MPNITRRDFMKYCSITAGVLGLSATDLLKLEKVLAAEGPETPDVVWLQGQCCTGCSTSLLNSVFYTTIDDVLLNIIDLQYHPTVMAAAGDLAVSALLQHYHYNEPCVLVVEGSIPDTTGALAEYCWVWEWETTIPEVPHKVTIQQAVEAIATGAPAVLAVGTCAAYGGIPAGNPNPTGAKSVKDFLVSVGISTPVVNIPGCPPHPDWIVGTIAYFKLFGLGIVDILDAYGRPSIYYPNIHEKCPYLQDYEAYLVDPGHPYMAGQLSDPGCLFNLGCKGPDTGADCPTRRWNCPAHGEYGASSCIMAGAPCQGCTEPDFPDGKSPFFTL
jgi:hydrogenase small subunit